MPNHTTAHVSIDAFVIMPDHIHGIIVIHHPAHGGRGRGRDVACNVSTKIVPNAIHRFAPFIPTIIPCPPYPPRPVPSVSLSVPTNRPLHGGHDKTDIPISHCRDVAPQRLYRDTATSLPARSNSRIPTTRLPGRVTPRPVGISSPFAPGIDNRSLATSNTASCTLHPSGISHTDFGRISPITPPHTCPSTHS